MNNSEIEEKLGNEIDKKKLDFPLFHVCLQNRGSSNLHTF